MKAKILVIDDDPLNLKMAAHLLKKHDYEVCTAHSGREGLALAQTEQPQLVLLDLRMPDMDGLAVLEALRADAATAQLHVIVLTASDLNEDAVRTAQLGVHDFIHKPFLPTEFIERVRSALQAKGRDRVLIVDDERLNRMLAQRALGSRYEVICAASGEEALSILESSAPNLALIDLHMPDMNGRELFSAIREKPKFARLPVIFLTADPDQRVEAELLRLGADDFIQKPFVPEVALVRIGRVLELNHYQRSLQDEVDRKTEELRESHIKMENLTVQVMKALAGAIDAKDGYTRGHSMRVAAYSRELARRLGKSEQEINDIYYIGILHDIGKIGVPNAIINKPSRLTDEEYAVMKSHPVIGANILNNITELPDISIGAHYHHERYDGKGYPDGLAGESIPEVARIIAVADAYDAMTSCRSYRSMLSQAYVRDQIERGRGTQFDPIVADCMLQMIDEDTEYVMRETPCGDND